MRRTVPLVLLLAWLLLLPGCEGKGGKTGDAVPAPAPESAAPASPAPTEEPERVSAAGSYGDVAAALKLAEKLGKGKTVVTILPDTAERYFSTPLFD